MPGGRKFSLPPSRPLHPRKHDSEASCASPYDERNRVHQDLKKAYVEKSTKAAYLALNRRWITSRRSSPSLQAFCEPLTYRIIKRRYVSRESFEIDYEVIAGRFRLDVNNFDVREDFAKLDVPKALGQPWACAWIQQGLNIHWNAPIPEPLNSHYQMVVFLLRGGSYEDFL